jgi:homoserine/homoserine lactone efflux protein
LFLPPARPGCEPGSLVVSIETILAFTAIAWLAILSPGPATVLALRNGASLGPGAVVWSSLGNITGLALLSSAAMLGLGALLMSSALLFAITKIVGALYLFYIGVRHIFGRATVIGVPAGSAEQPSLQTRFALYREGVLMAVTNPKPILFFTALFPPFLDTEAPLLPQFLTLTGIFMVLSFITLLTYATLAIRLRRFLIKPRFAAVVNRIVGAVFVAFGAFLLALRRPPA